MATAEFAVALPALALVLVLAVSALATSMDQIRCIDAARATVRSLARGDNPATAVAVGRRLAPAAASIATTESPETVTVTVRSPSAPALRWLGARASPRGEAVAVRELTDTETPP